MLFRVGVLTLGVVIPSAALAVVLSGSAAVAGDERPLHTHKSTTIKAGPTYIVEGRKRVPPGCRLSIQKGVRIVGRGDNPVLVVAGAVHIHGVEVEQIIIENLQIVLAPRFEILRLDYVRLSGDIRTAPDAPADGRLQVENAAIEGKIDVTLTGGEVDLLDAGFSGEVRIRGVPASGKKRSTARVKLLGCGGIDDGPYGFRSGVFLTGLTKAVVRNCGVGGYKSEFIDCKALMFDGNLVTSSSLTFRNPDAALFKGTKLLKNDIYSTSVVFSAPLGKKRVVVPVDKCWFRGVTDPEEIHELISDGRDDPKVGVVVKLRRLSEKVHGLGGRRK